MVRVHWRVWLGCAAACAAAAGEAPRGVLLELERPPAVAADTALRAAKRPEAERKAAVSAHLAAIEADQQAVLDALARKTAAPVLFRAQLVYNGIAVAGGAPPAVLAGLPGVKAVHPLARVAPDNGSSMPFIGAVDVWQRLGLTGAGVRIGIIDTGIDYLHADFGGTGAAADHAANDVTVLGDIPFPTAKVAGGWDFAGDDYNALDPDNNEPVADPDPMDANGHGTHVAGTAAGLGVNSAGAAYAGAYGTATPLPSMRVGPGAAPEAALYALKIFGRNGSSDVLIPAIEWAVDPDGDGDFSDRLDVINMSLGEDFGAADAPESAAADNAALAGVIVVASAGNARDTHYIMSLPGSAPRAIAVAASEDTGPAGAGFVPDRLASFSSRGPAPSIAIGALLKPDLAAPGRSIASAAAYAVSPSATSSVRSGTSMAAPHVAGMMALLRQARPDWSVAQLKALTINTASAPLSAPDGIDAPGVAPQRGGAGRIDAAAALGGEVIVYGAAHPERVSLSFAMREIAEPASESQPVRIENLGSAPVSFTAALDAFSNIPGAALRLEGPGGGTIAPGGSAELALVLEADPAALRHVRDPGAAPAYTIGGGSVARSYIAEASGAVLVALAGIAGPLRLPYYAALRPAARMAAAADLLDVRGNPAAAVALDGAGLDSGGAPPEAVRSLVQAFEVLHASPDEPESTGLADAADVRLLGVSSDYAAQAAAGGGIEDTTIAIAIAVYGAWSTPHYVRVFCFIDTNGDGLQEFLLDETSLRSADPAAGGLPDVFVTRLANLENETAVQGFVNHLDAADYDTRLFDTNVMVLPVKAADLGLDAEHTTIGLRVQTLLTPGFGGAEQQRPVDALPAGSDAFIAYDVARPGLQFAPGIGGHAMYSAQAGASIAVSYDAEPYAAQGSLGILLVHHHNLAGARDELLPVMTAGDTDRDGIDDAAEGIGDPDGDRFPNLIDGDSDGDGLTDAAEGVGDPDGDDAPNYLDTDSDGDTVDDAVESGWGTDPYAIDSDDDGLGDAFEGIEDADGDETGNALDEDSDGDSIGDAIEGARDIDGDGTPGYLDLDSDDDTLPDRGEGTADLDGDGAGNWIDLDSDGDTLSDLDEVTVYATSPVLADSDADGRSDAAELSAGTDPNAPDAPAAPAGASATDGTREDGVEVTWTAAAGAAEYRVYRAAANDAGAAAPIGAWQTGTRFVDTSAAPPAAPDGPGCRRSDPEYTAYYYWVAARNAGGESALGGPDAGYRGGDPCPRRAASVDAATLMLAVAAIALRRRAHAAGSGPAAL